MVASLITVCSFIWLSGSSSFSKYTGHQCEGGVPDIERDFEGTADECKARCVTLGCVGFVRVNTNGKCYFRSAPLGTPYDWSDDDRDCYVYAVEVNPTTADSFSDITVETRSGTVVDTTVNKWSEKIGLNIVDDWAVILTLDSSSYGFHPTQESSITVTVNIDCTNQCDEFYAFGFDEYFISFAHDLDGALRMKGGGPLGGLFIYPPAGSSSLGEGDPSGFITGRASLGSGTWGALRSEKNYTFTNENGLLSLMDATIVGRNFPVTFTFTNDPTTSEFTVTFTQDTTYESGSSATFATTAPTGVDFKFFEVTDPSDSSNHRVSYTVTSENTGTSHFDSIRPNEFEGMTLHCADNQPCSITCDEEYSCRSASIICPPTESCEVDCSADNSCRSPSITWPTEVGLGSLLCSGKWACRAVNFPIPNPSEAYHVLCGGAKGICSQATINCPASASCEVDCSADYSCQAATINCPASASCEVDCSADYSCHSASITWPTEVGLGSLLCSGQWACNGVNFPIPNASAPYSVPCDVYGTCFDATINCPASASCEVDCSADYSCHSASITWPTEVGLGSLLCSGQWACNGVNFPIPNASAPYSVPCDVYGTCFDATINCPASASCEVDCSADYSCHSASITWPTEAGLGSLSCSGKWACYGVNFPIPNPSEPYSVLCGGAKGICSQATINCPASASCEVDCSADYSCQAATINCPASANCSITCNGEYSCDQATVNCPTGAPCELHCSNDLNACNSMTVNTVEDQSASETIPLIAAIFTLSILVFIGIFVSMSVLYCSGVRKQRKYKYEAVQMINGSELDHDMHVNDE
eukprot:137687_1